MASAALSLRRPRTSPLVVAGSLAALWLVLQPRTADFAAQVYRSRLFSQEGFALWDNAWFGGHFLPGYSLVFPPLASLFGAQAVGVVAVLCSVGLFTYLMRHIHADRARAATVWFAAAAVGDLFIGRITFAIGVAMGLAAVTAFARGRRAWAAAFGVACAAASPIAGLFLVLVALAAYRRIGRAGFALLAGPTLVAVALMDTVFPDGGEQPFDLAAAAGGIALVLLVAHASERGTVVRRGALLYAGAIALSYVVPSPMGSNVARLGVLLAGPLLLITTGNWRRPAVLAACAGIAVWQLWGPVTEVAKTFDNPSTGAAYYTPLNNFLESAHAASGRVEVVPTQTHWESVYVAERFALARGWESQLDERYNPLFYNGTLTAASYYGWLRASGVRYVAVSDAPPERWGRQETALLAKPPAYLRPVWHDSHWRVFAVRGSDSLVYGAARLVALDPNGFVVHALRSGPILVRVNYTQYWHTDGAACVQRGIAGLTEVSAWRAGDVSVRARWSLGAALSSAPECGTGAPPPPVPATTLPPLP